MYVLAMPGALGARHCPTTCIVKDIIIGYQPQRSHIVRLVGHATLKRSCLSVSTCPCGDVDLESEEEGGRDVFVQRHVTAPVGKEGPLSHLVPPRAESHDVARRLLKCIGQVDHEPGVVGFDHNRLGAGGGSACVIAEGGRSAWVQR